MCDITLLGAEPTSTNSSVGVFYLYSAHLLGTHGQNSFLKTGLREEGV